MSRHTISVTAIIYSDETGMTGFIENLMGGIAVHGKTHSDVVSKLRHAVQFYVASNEEAIAMIMEPLIINARRERFAVEVELPDTVDL